MTPWLGKDDREKWIGNRTDEIMDALEAAHMFYVKNLEALRLIAQNEAELEANAEELRYAQEKAA